MSRNTAVARLRGTRPGKLRTRINQAPALGHLVTLLAIGTPLVAWPPGNLAAVVTGFATTGGGARPASSPDTVSLRGGDHRCPASLDLLVERSYAASAGLRTGAMVSLRSTPEASACPARIAGIMETPPDPARLVESRPRVMLRLPHLQQLADRNDQVDHFSVALRPGADPDQTADNVAPLLVGTQVLLTQEVARQSSTTFQVVNQFHSAIAGITLVAGGVFLTCIMVLKVQERREAVAAARLAGISRRILLGWTIAEAALLSVAGGVAGLGVGLAASWAVNTYYQWAYDTSLVFSRVTGTTVLQALALAVPLGLGAGVFAGRRLLRNDPLGTVTG